MKAIARTVTVVAAALMIAAVPVLAEDTIMGQQEMQDQKNECLLVAQNCPTDSIQERIQRIQGEIGKGTDVYSADELRRLNRQLEEAEKLLDYEMTNGGG
jgi:hypothetical protein